MPTAHSAGKPLQSDIRRTTKALRFRKGILFLWLAAVSAISSAAGLMAQWDPVPAALVSSSDPVEEWMRAIEDGGAIRNQVLEQARYTCTRPAVGDCAPNFTLRDLDGNEVRLHDFIGRVPAVLELSSFT